MYAVLPLLRTCLAGRPAQGRVHRGPYYYYVGYDAEPSRTGKVDVADPGGQVYLAPAAERPSPAGSPSPLRVLATIFSWPVKVARAYSPAGSPSPLRVLAPPATGGGAVSACTRPGRSAWILPVAALAVGGVASVLPVPAVALGFLLGLALGQVGTRLAAALRARGWEALRVPRPSAVDPRLWASWLRSGGRRLRAGPACRAVTAIGTRARPVGGARGHRPLGGQPAGQPRGAQGRSGFAARVHPPPGPTRPRRSSLTPHGVKGRSSGATRWPHGFRPCDFIAEGPLEVRSP